MIIRVLLHTIKRQSILVPKIHYNFIFGKLLKKTREKLTKQQNSFKQQQEKQENQKAVQYVDDDEPEDSYDFFQRQKQIEVNQDFRKIRKENQASIIPEDIGKGGFNELVYWSQQAKTPQKILELVKKFNKVSLPKNIEDKLNYNHFKANVQATVYLADSYPSLSEYALFGYKYQILESTYWLKIQEKILRKIPANEQQVNQLIDIAFVMGILKAGQYTYNTVQKLLVEKQLNIDQTTKLIICFFRAQKGQKDWLVKLLMNFTQKMDEVNSDILESILPIIKQSRNIPEAFDQKLQLRIKEMINQLSISAICTISSYFGFQKGGQTLWMSLQERSMKLISDLRKEKKKIPSKTMVRLIQGAMGSYKFSTEFIREEIVKQLEANNYLALRKISSKTLSTLAKNIYIYQLQVQAQQMCEVIQGIIMDRFSALDNVSNQELIHVLKEYTVTRNGSRDLYKFLQRAVHNKLADIHLQRQTVQKFIAIYQQSNLCQQQTLQILKGFLL